MDLVQSSEPVSEQPKYVLQQNKSRALIPKIVSLFVLGIIFYLGVLVNISLLELKGSEETIVNIISLILVLCVIAVGIYLAFHKAHLNYKFYQSKIIFDKQTIAYLEIKNTLPKQDFIDKIFNTYTINLGNNFFIRNVPKTVDIQNYLQQLVDYAKSISY